MLEEPIRGCNYEILFNTKNKVVNEQLRRTTHSFKFVRDATTNTDILTVTFDLYTDNFDAVYNLLITKEIPLKVFVCGQTYNKHFPVWDAVTKVENITFAGDCFNSKIMKVVVTFGRVK